MHKWPIGTLIQRNWSSNNRGAITGQYAGRFSKDYIKVLVGNELGYYIDRGWQELT